VVKQAQHWTLGEGLRIVAVKPAARAEGTADAETAAFPAAAHGAAQKDLGRVRRRRLSVGLRTID
jgi:hypothetical protein